MWMSHVIHVNESWHSREWVMSHTHMNESCHIIWKQGNESMLHVTYLIHTCDMPHSYVWLICIHVAWLIHVCDMTNPYMWDASFILTWLIHKYQSYTWHDSCISMTWLETDIYSSLSLIGNCFNRARYFDKFWFWILFFWGDAWQAWNTMWLSFVRYGYFFFHFFFPTWVICMCCDYIFHVTWLVYLCYDLFDISGIWCCFDYCSWNGVAMYDVIHSYLKNKRNNAVSTNKWYSRTLVYSRISRSKATNNTHEQEQHTILTNFRIYSYLKIKSST